MQKVISGAGHGFQNVAGSTITAEIIANVTIEGGSDQTDIYYLQVYLNGSPIDLIAAQTIEQGGKANLSLSFMYQVPHNGIITMHLQGNDEFNCTILTRSLTMKKTQ